MPGDVRITVTRTLSKDQQERRTRLIDAARELALQGGYHAVTMHDVADRAELEAVIGGQLQEAGVEMDRIA